MGEGSAIGQVGCVARLGARAGRRRSSPVAAAVAGRRGPATLVVMKTELHITGMTCKGCVRHVEGALRKRSGVAEVQVTLEGGRAVVEHDPAVTAQELCAVVEEAGYQGSAVSS